MIRKSVLILTTIIVFVHCSETQTPVIRHDCPPQLTFVVAADMRDFTGDNPAYFRGACGSIDSIGAGAFMISPGDIDPPAEVLATIEAYIDTNRVWYPVLGNHEAETPDDMDWLRDYMTGNDAPPNIVRTGPAGCEETSYSFEYADVHFTVINEYYDGVSDVGTDGDVVTRLYNWIVTDLRYNTKPIVFVCGHEPAYPQPDEDNGRLRHEDDSLNKFPANRDRFWGMLKEHGVLAYFCGHPHNFSAVKIDGVWQIDVGHARGTGDTGARSTYIRIVVLDGGGVLLEVYRLDPDTGRYVMTRSERIR